MTNLRFKLNKESGLQDLAEAMKSPFIVSVKDIGEIGGIAYTPKMREFYSKMKDNGSVLDSHAVPDVVAFRTLQHYLPESEKEAKDLLGKLSEMRMNPEISLKQYLNSEEWDRAYCSPEVEGIRVIPQRGENVVGALLRRLMRFQYDERLEAGVHKPLWMSESDWLGEESRGSVHSTMGYTIHSLKTAWGRMGAYFAMTNKK